jgi:cell division protein FtsN
VYTIQIYLGNKRQTATYIRNKANKIFTGIKAKIYFEPPYYKVRVGEFTNRIKANQAFQKAQKEFKNASLVPLHFKAADF